MVGDVVANRPACVAAIRGMLWWEFEDTSAADTLWTCRKGVGGAGALEWASVTLTPE